MKLDSIAILRHGVRSVLNNALATLRISWPWLIIFAVIFSVLFYMVKQSGFGTTPLEPERGAGTFSFSILIGAIVYLIGFSSIAVNWHRYILLDEFPSVSGSLRLDGLVWQYLVRAIAAVFLTFLIILVPLIIVAMVAPALILPPTSTGGGENSPFGAAPILWIGQAILTSFITAIFFRFGLALPATAVGRPEIGIFDSWRRTGGLFGSLLMIAAGTAVMQLIAQVAIEGVTLALVAINLVFGMIISVLLSIIVTWFFTFLGITLLTTLYGHIVQKRPL